MAVVISLQCPFCGTKHVSCSLHVAKQMVSGCGSSKPRATNIEAVGECAACGSYLITYFRVNSREISANEFWAAISGGGPTSFESLKAIIPSLTFCGVRPELRGPSIPRFLPDNVARSLREAEEARLAGLWSAAAALYRKAVDRGVTEVLAENEQMERAARATLGQKLGNLERSELLPKVMLDWIRIVKNDGDFALHDDDRDFSSSEEIDGARRFAHLLLEYLFTLPEEVKRAKGED